MELVVGCKCKPQTRKENLHWAGRNTLVHLDVGYRPTVAANNVKNRHLWASDGTAYIADFSDFQ